MADVTLATRQPTIRFPRVQAFELGSKVSLYWNGEVAANGDGKPTGGAIDTDNPIAGPLPIWVKGHRSTFGGGFGRGGFASAGAVSDPSMGFAKGPFGRGGFGVGGGFWTWKPKNQWRNGEYTIEALIRDDTGNEQAWPIGTITVEILDVPRPATSARLEAYDPGTTVLTVGLIASPDFQP